MKILTRKQAIEQGYTAIVSPPLWAYKEQEGRLDWVHVVGEREEELVEALRRVLREAEALSNGTTWPFAHRLLEKYDEQD